jgi:hypothetical protein
VLKQMKEPVMKTKLLLSAMVAAFAVSTFAGDVNLSPRAKDNQIKVVKSTTEKAPATVASTVTASPKLLSPRAADNQIAKISGVANERNPYLECQKTMTGSPKAVQACIESGAMPCMTVAPLK